MPVYQRSYTSHHDSNTNVPVVGLHVPDLRRQDSMKSVVSESSDHTPTMSWARTSSMTAPAAPTSKTTWLACRSSCKESAPMNNDSMANKVVGGTTSYSPRTALASLGKDHGYASPESSPSLTESCTSFDSAPNDPRDSLNLVDKNQLGDHLEAAALGARTSCFARSESSIQTFNSIALEGSQDFINGSTETSVSEDNWKEALAKNMEYVQQLTQEAADNMSKTAKVLQDEPTSDVLTAVVQARLSCFTENVKSLFQGE